MENSKRYFLPSLLKYKPKKYDLKAALLSNLRAADCGWKIGDLLSLTGKEVQHLFKSSSEPRRLLQGYIKKDLVRLTNDEYLINPGYLFYGALIERDAAYKLWNDSQFNPETLGKHSLRLIYLESENHKLAGDCGVAKVKIGELEKDVINLKADLKISNERGDSMFRRVNEQAITLQEVQATQSRMEALLKSLGHQPPY
jgi:hypothetical protein